MSLYRTKVISLVLTALLFVAWAGYARADGTDVMGNVVYGTNAGAGLETDATGNRANGNTFIGLNAGRSDSTGNANTAFGYSALSRLTSGTGNIAIGYLAGDANTTSSHRLYIQNGFYPTYGIFGDLANGYIGINNIAPDVALDVTGDAEVSGTIKYLKPILDSVTGYTLTAAQSGSYRWAYNIAADVIDTLPAASAGLFFKFAVDDGDSLVITTASGDSIKDGKAITETAVIFTSSITGSCELTAVDATYWVLSDKVGTWTEYNID